MTLKPEAGNLKISVIVAFKHFFNRNIDKNTNMIFTYILKRISSLGI